MRTDLTKEEAVDLYSKEDGSYYLMSFYLKKNGEYINDGKTKEYIWSIMPEDALYDQYKAYVKAMKEAAVFGHFSWTHKTDVLAYKGKWGKDVPTLKAMRFKEKGTHDDIFVTIITYKI